MAENTEVTATETPPTTEESGKGENQAGSENQEIGTKFEEFEKKIQKLEEVTQKATALEAELNQERGKSAQAEAKYKGLQNQTTRKLQEAAQLQRQLQGQAATAQELAQLRQLVEYIARRDLDEGEAQQLEVLRREAAVQAREQALTQPQQQTNYNVVDETTRKQQFLEAYFPNSGIDPDDPNLDWGEGLTDQGEAFRRLSTSVKKV